MTPAPKELQRNVEYRRKLIERAANDKGFQKECRARCAEDIEWYADTFAFTYNPKDYPDNPVRPFILWEYQVEALKRINAAIGKHDMLVEKSRDMGASWLCLLILEWRWHFRPNQSFLLVSRVQDLVDKTNEPDALFWKVDFLHENMPGWMLPPKDRNSMSLHNLINGSTITGASTTGETGRGGRKTAILLDEFAAVPDGYSMLSATRDATNTRIMNSTPKGAAGAYYDQRENMAAKSPERVLRLHWASHPLKRRGLYGTEGDREGAKLRIIDTDYKFAPNYKFIRDGKMRSVWYDEQCSRAPNQQEIAQEIDIDYAASGWQFFDSKILSELKAKHCRQPIATGEIIKEPDWEHPKWMQQSGARLQLWFEPTMEGTVPKAWNDIGIGCDIASGSGGEMSSNSSASIVRRTTGEKIGEFTTNLMNPADFAHYVLALCKWFNGAYLGFERNGPNGAQFAKVVRDSNYRNVFRPTREIRFGTERTKDIGWWSDDNTKPILLRTYAEALVSGAFINHSAAAITECGHYVQNGNKIEHARSLVSEDPTATGASHGDRVIADAIANRLIADMPKESLKATEKPPAGSYLERRKNWERRQTKTTRGWGRIAG